MKRFVAGLGSLLLLGVLLVGIPAALVILAGNPIPSGEELARAVTYPDYSGEFFIGTVMPLVAWIAWLTFAIGFVVEIPFLARDVEAPRLPLLGMQQRLAAGLLGAVIIMFSSFGSFAATPAVAAPLEQGLDSSISQTFDAAAAPAEASPTEVPAPEAPAVPAPTYAVTEGDSLWSISEQVLGSGERFAEIAQLNYGVAQPDGGALGTDNWLSPGWVLTLPADAVLPSTAPAAGQHTVEAGDTLWDLAEQVYGDGAQYQQIADSSPGISDPNLIFPGQVVELPGSAAAAAPAPAAVEPAPVATPDPVAPVEVPTDEAAPADAVPDTTDSSTTDESEAPTDLSGAGIAPTPAATEPAPTADAEVVTSDVDEDTFDEAFFLRTAGGIGALMAAGLLSVLGFRRAQQRRRRKMGQRISMPTVEASTIELELRAVENPNGMADIDQALRYLAVWAQDNQKTLPPIYAIRLADSEIALYLDTPTELPAPFVAAADDHTAWTIEPADLPELSRIPSPPYPALVTIGQDQTDAHILVDLEHLGALNIIASPEDSDGALTALAVELATSQWAEDLQITLVGIAPGLPQALETGRIRHVDDLDTLLRNLRGQAAATERTLENLGVASIEEARSLTPDAEAWIPEIVILAELPAQEIQDELASLVTRLPRLGIAAVTTGHLAGEWILNIEDSTTASLTLPEGRGSIPLVPQIVNVDEYTRILDLLDVTEQAPTDAPNWSTDINTGEIDLAEIVPSSHYSPPSDQVPSLEDAETETIVDDEASGDAPADAPVTLPDPIDRVDPRSAFRGPWVKFFGPMTLVDPRGAEPLTPGTATPSNSLMNKATELIAFLTLNGGANHIEVHGAMWPGKDPSGEKAAYSRNGIASKARKWLGNADDGSPYFPKVGTDGYRLHPEVQSDWSLWCDLIGDDLSKTSTEDLVAALQLVDGQPITGVKDRNYAWAERIRQEMIASIGDAAHELAERSLRCGDVRSARLAAAVGRQVDPINEIFWRDAIKAECQAGDKSGAERIINQLLPALDDYEEGYEPEDETQELIARVRELEHA